MTKQAQTGGQTARDGSEVSDNLWRAFLLRHRLPDAYRTVAQTWFVPLADQLYSIQQQQQRPLVVGIHGCQGSGKSTLADFLFSVWVERGLSVVSLSLDDFYLTRDERQQLGRQIHPLLATRGVPGTHDVGLANRVIDALLAPEPDVVDIPRFDKARDDRVPDRDWERVPSPVDIVILEGWCLGVPPQSSEQLRDPVNELESREDPDGIWRKFANDVLATTYPSLFARIGQWVMLQAPSFDCVTRWRLEQERKLAARADIGNDNRVMSAAEVGRFIQHYQRLTEHGLTALPARVQHLYALDETRNIVSYLRPLDDHD